MPVRKLLILGGTGEAAALAHQAMERFGDSLHVTSSLAGRTARPAKIAGHLRTGGFGGAAGLTRYLTAQGVDCLIDATHPFAATISRHARQACDQAQVPRLQLQRAAWRKQRGDHWILVDDAVSAARALADHGGRALVTIGVQELSPFTGLPCLVRLIDRPAPPFPFEVITGRGPFTIPAEKQLFMDQRIDILVTKASGGTATRAKITAARMLGLPIVMIRRPLAEPGDKTRSISGALDWIANKFTTEGQRSK